MRWFAGLFDRVAPSTSAALAAHRRAATFAAGADVLRTGERPDSLHCVRRGKVKVWRPVRSGSTMTFYYMGDGAPIGLIAVLRDSAMGLTVTAVGAVDTWYWPAALIRRLLHEDARLAANGMRIIGGALGMVSDRLEDATGASAHQQIARALLRLAGEQADQRSEREAVIDISRQELADLTGTTLYTASRTLSDWGRQGLIASRRGRVTIKDAAGLATVADVEV